MKPIFILLLLLLNNSITQAALVNRGNGFIYDNVLNVTWLQDANYANTSGYVTAAGRDVSNSNGKMSWGESIDWANQLTYGGFTEWRLPDVKPVNGSNFQIEVSFDGSTDFGEHITSTQSELSYMYNINLNNPSAHDATGFLIGCGAADSCLNNTADFTNLIPYNYWFGVEVGITPAFAWSFNTQHGVQTLYDGKTNEFHAWAVHDGDIAPVPLPAAFWLFSTSIISFLGAYKNRN